MIPNCAATRHAHFTLDGRGEAGESTPRVDLNTVTQADVESWKSGEVIFDKK